MKVKNDKQESRASKGWAHLVRSLSFYFVVRASLSRSWSQLLEKFWVAWTKFISKIMRKRQVFLLRKQWIYFGCHGIITLCFTSWTDSRGKNLSHSDWWVCYRMWCVSWVNKWPKLNRKEWRSLPDRFDNEKPVRIFRVIWKESHDWRVFDGDVLQRWSWRWLISRLMLYFL